MYMHKIIRLFVALNFTNYWSNANNRPLKYFPLYNTSKTMISPGRLSNMWSLAQTNSMKIECKNYQLQLFHNISYAEYATSIHSDPLPYYNGATRDVVSISLMCRGTAINWWLSVACICAHGKGHKVCSPVRVCHTLIYSSAYELCFQHHGYVYKTRTHLLIIIIICLNYMLVLLS